MRKVWRVGRWLLFGLVLVIIGGYWYERPLLLTATAYGAHNDCAVTNVAERDDPETDLPPNPLVPVLRTDKDGKDRTEGTLLNVLAKQEATYREGFGCTISNDTLADLPEPAPVSAANNPYAAAPTPPSNPDLDAAIGKAFGDDLSQTRQEALGTRAVLVLKDGKLVAERYADGFTKDTRQLGWSMTKSVTSLMVGTLVEQGKVSLEDNQLRPEWKDRRADITIEQLLRMTSGLEWDETYDLGTPITRMLYLEDDMGDYVASQKSKYPPGQHQQYSSGSTSLLCDILIDKLDADANLPRTTIFAPLGMSSAVLEPDASGTPVCSSYLWATPRDWAAVGQFALQNGEWNGEQLLPQEWMTLSASTPRVETQDEGYGMGWWLNTLPDGSAVYPELPPDAYFAEGHDGQWIVIVPSEQLVVVRLGFSPEVDEVGAAKLAADVIAVG